MLKYIVLISIVVSGCHLRQYQTNQKTFEGELQYTLEFETFDDENTLESLQAKFGTSMTQIMKNEAYLLNYTYPENTGELKVLFDLKEKIGLTEISNFDTLLQFDILINKDQMISANFNDGEYEVANGIKCNSITIKYIPNEKLDGIEHIEATYHFNPKYVIDQEFYGIQKLSFLDVYYEMSNGAIALNEEILYFPKFKVKHKLKSIVERKIRNIELELDQEKSVRELTN